MTAPTHVAFGVFTTAGLFALFSQSLHKDWLALGMAMLGSLLPDIDTPKSSLGRLLPFVSMPLERRWGHRTLTHSVLFLATLGIVLLPLRWWETTAYFALLIGYASHLLADCATKSGVPLFYPHLSVCVFPGNARYRFKTGALGERILLVVLLLLLGLVFPLANLGGTWRAVRYLLATPQMAYNDYREASGACRLDFKGRWKTTRQPVEGQALILEGSPSGFLIYFQERVLAYGEDGEILPDRTRVTDLQEPLRLDTLRVEQLAWEAIVEHLPDSALVTGRLRSNVAIRFPSGIADADPAWLQKQKNALHFTYASTAQLRTLQPAAAIDSAQIEQLQEKIAQATQRLKALQLQRPPAHIRQIKAAGNHLAERRQHLSHLANPTLHFSGHLSLRILGDSP